MSFSEIATSHYESARTELIERIQLRDTVMLAYLGAIGTLFGVALATSVSRDVLLIVPFLTVGAALIVSQHNSVIGSIGSFLVNEYEPFIKTIGQYAPQWDSSKALHDYSLTSVWFRAAGHFVLIIIPSIAALVMTYQDSYLTFPTGSFWWFTIICTISALVILLHSDRWRKRLYQKYKWQSMKTTEHESISQE